jgi:hypothetical protein
MLMRHRDGATLVEVLVAIFVMAVGLLTLLALFPLGVLTMSQAIQDDRCASAATNATAIAAAWDIRHDPNLTNPTDLFTNPNPAVFVNADTSGPSYWVYVDPMGALSYFGTYAQWVGGQNNGGIPRVFPTIATTSMTAKQWFSLLDDIQYGDSGLPNIVAPNTFERDNLYTWAYLLRRPLQNDPTVVELTVVAYNARSLALNSKLQGDEAAFTAVFNPATNIVTLNWAVGQAAPNLRIGGWILDASTFQDPNTKLYSQPHAYFYRVVGINETSDTSMDVEVQTPLRGWPGPAGLTASPTVIVMDGVAEVFEKGTGWRP